MKSSKNNTNFKLEEEIDLLQLAGALWHRAWIIILAMIVGGAILFGVTTFFITPKYEASAMIYVNNSSVSLGNTKVSITSGDLTAQQGLIDTYSVILKSRNTLEPVIEKGGFPFTYEQLAEKITAESVDETGVLKITVTDTDPDVCTSITNTIVDVLPTRITNIVEGSSVEVVDKAVVPARPVSPNRTKNTAIGMLIGLLISAGLISVNFMSDTTIRSEDYIYSHFDSIPILATIPDLTDTHSSGYYYYRAKEGEKNG